MILLRARAFEDEEWNHLRFVGEREHELAAILQHHLIERDWSIEVELEPEELNDAD